jgi:hypothetical protein
MNDFPSSIEVKKIDCKASTYNQYSVAYQTFADLFQGGSVLQDAVVNRARYLLQKPKEVRDVFKTRQQRFSYTNLLGNIIGWYGAALFKEPAQIIKKLAGVVAAIKGALVGTAATPTAPPAIPKESSDFCEAFEKDSDHAGTTFADFWRKVFESAVLHKAAYVLIDLPVLDPDAPAPYTLDQQTKAGLLNPFLVVYTPSQVINWETDRYGNLTWCIIHVVIEERAAFEKPVTVDYWYYFDTLQVACYKAVREDDHKGYSDTDMADMVEGYPRKHAMSDLKRIPVRKVEVPDGLWLANRVFLPLLNHLNLDNAYDFGLYQSALAQLVITGEFDDAITLSEVAYLKLQSGATAEYLEPEGRAYEAISKRLDGLEERIYKACYLMDQARTNKATAAAQSGLSKQQDKTPSRDSLAGLGDVIRPAMQLVYTDVLAVRGLTNVEIDVRGFDFEDKAGVEELDFMISAGQLDIQSDTYRRERDKKAGRRVLSDANPEVLAAMDKEIDANPTPEAAAAALVAQQQAQQAAGFADGMKGAAGIDA